MKLEVLLKAPRKRPICVGSGLVALDVIINGSNTEEPRVLTGGSCGNVLTILSYLGWLSAPLARVGKDEAGKRLVEDLRRWKVRTRGLLKDASIETPIVVERIISFGNGRTRHRFEWRCPCCDRWLPRNRPLTIKTAETLSRKLPNPNVFYCDRTAPSIRMLAERYRKHGALIVFEPASVGNINAFRTLASSADIIKYSHDRLGHSREALRGLCVPLEIETLGPAGLRYRDRRQDRKTRKWRSLDAVAAPQVEDVVGAGDWCTAGMLHTIGRRGREGFFLADHKELRDSLGFGQALATLNCMYQGARGPMYELTRSDFRKMVTGITRSGEPVVVKGGGAMSVSNATLAIICSDCRDRTRER